VDGTGALRPKFDKDFDTEQNSDRDVFWPLSRSVGSDRAPFAPTRFPSRDFKPASPLVAAEWKVKETPGDGPGDGCFCVIGRTAAFALLDVRQCADRISRYS